jgi:hypothetical protein
MHFPCLYVKNQVFMTPLFVAEFSKSAAGMELERIYKLEDISILL